MDLAKSLADFIKDLPDDSEYTIDDWYNIVGIPVEERSDFVTAAIFNQIQKRKLL